MPTPSPPLSISCATKASLPGANEYSSMARSVTGQGSKESGEMPILHGAQAASAMCLIQES